MVWITISENGFSTPRPLHAMSRISIQRSNYSGFFYLRLLLVICVSLLSVLHHLLTYVNYQFFSSLKVAAGPLLCKEAIHSVYRICFVSYLVYSPFQFCGRARCWISLHQFLYSAYFISLFVFIFFLLKQLLRYREIYFCVKKD